MSAYRLASGGLVNRSQPLNFTFDGKAMKGFDGDTLASALLANDQLLVGRSFKYHRPRGVVTAGSAEPNALVSIGPGGRPEPNTPATVAALYQGLSAVRQNRWPSPKSDLGSLNSPLSPFLAASTTRPSCGRQRSGEDVRAFHPQSSRSRQGCHAGRSRPL